jgi:putative membrane protein
MGGFRGILLLVFPFILVQMLLQDFSFSVFRLFSLYVAIAGALSSVIPSSILPKMEKTRLKNADEMVECFRYLVDGYS